MKLSFWEQDSWFTNVDFTIVGSGITGLNCALRIKERFPSSKVLVLERGALPNGASTKNAGFACFGSLSEILDDLINHSEEEVVNLVEKRANGIEHLKKTLGIQEIDLQINGGYELFSDTDDVLFEECKSKRADINRLLKTVFRKEVFSLRQDPFGFKNVKQELIFNQFEGQLNTGKMMMKLIQKAQSSGVIILNSITVEDYSDINSSVEIKTGMGTFKSGKLLIATNGFATKLGFHEVNPARAQVLITKPICNLNIKGTFHFDKGYYYFRNVDNRILLGGGRNLDFPAEETTRMDVTKIVQDKLEELLATTILPGTEFTIDRRWSGIMGVGEKKNPIVRNVSENVYCGIRLGGMGVAIGSLTGRELADLIE